MSRKVSEIARFLAWYANLGEEAKRIVGDQVRDAIRAKKTQVSRRGVKAPIALADSQIEKAGNAAKQCI